MKQTYFLRLPAKAVKINMFVIAKTWVVSRWATYKLLPHYVSTSIQGVIQAQMVDQILNNFFFKGS